MMKTKAEKTFHMEIHKLLPVVFIYLFIFIFFSSTNTLSAELSAKIGGFW